MRGSQFAELSVFVAVAEEASFTKAAKRLGLSNATLSQSVRSLEEQLGTRLLNRTTRSVSLTDAGERLLSQLRPLLDGFDAAIESINAFRDRPTGHLRLTMPPPVAKFILAPLLGRFMKQYPEIAMEISVGGHFADIVAGRFDAGFNRGDFIPRDMVAVRISEDIHYVTVASPDYMRQHEKPRVPADLLSHNCIQFRLPDGSFLRWRFHSDGKEFDVDVTGTLQLNDIDLAISAALDGFGVIYTVEEYVTPMLEDGRLVRVLEKDVMPAHDAFFMFYPSRRQNPAALRALIDFLRTNKRHAKDDKVVPNATPAIQDGRSDKVENRV
jgi:DNA-binding transcriptional LysR family regulator